MKRIRILGPSDRPRAPQAPVVAGKNKQKLLEDEDGFELKKKGSPGKAAGDKDATPHGSSQNLLGSGPSKVEDKSPVMLDVLLDRDVEVAIGAQKQWRSRNVPNIPGMKVEMRAWQDLEMIRFEVTLIFPHPRLRVGGKKSGGDELMDFNNADDTEEAFRTQDVSDGDLKPSKVLLTYRLTCAELSIFGAAEVMEERKISMSNKNLGENHPSAFMWNVLNRMQAVFKVMEETTTPPLNYRVYQTKIPLVFFVIFSLFFFLKILFAGVDCRAVF